jgi:hypothetical protein
MPLGSLIMSNIQPEPLRDAPMSMDDNGKPSWRGMCSHKNIKVRSACYHPVQLPGLIILFMGLTLKVNGMIQQKQNLCNGLNGRLNLPPYMKLKENIYQTGKTQLREIANPDASRSPVIRFYWGYSAEPGTEDNYQIPLRNLAGDDYHDLKNTRSCLMRKSPPAAPGTGVAARFRMAATSWYRCGATRASVNG